MSLKREVQQPTYIAVVEKIQELIRTGELAPGDQLLPERQLAEKLEVSRSSLREALAMLVGMAVLEVNARDGAYVRKRSLEDAIHPLALMVFQERENVIHLMEVRGIVETQAVRLAAERATRADVERLAETCRRVEDDIRAGRDAGESDTLFHLRIVECAKNPLVSQVMSMLTHVMKEGYGPGRRKLLADPDLAETFIREHADVVRAIERGDPSAAEAVMREHIAMALTHFLEQR
ncbi:MAG: lutR 2 [Firmicutes bacterium]|nr:lutR 2 [Bacillota bacterium]